MTGASHIAAAEAATQAEIATATILDCWREIAGIVEHEPTHASFGLLHPAAVAQMFMAMRDRAAIALKIIAETPWPTAADRERARRHNIGA